LTSTRPSRFFVYLVEHSNQVDADLLHTEKILADRKTFYLDLKQNSRGMVVKITEDVSGNRDTIMVPAEILGDFIAALNDIKATADEQE
jgi:PurA ssDNA and RNA-binding protein